MLVSKKEYDMNEKSSKEIKKNIDLGGGGGAPYTYTYIWRYIWGIVEKKMETTIVYGDYVGIQALFRCSVNFLDVLPCHGILQPLTSPGNSSTKIV